MTLFDGKPLTEEEIAERDVCVCGHIRRDHDILRTHWLDCPCEEFELADAPEEAGA